MSTAPARLATDGAETPTIALRGVSRVYGKGESTVRALDGVDFTVARGEFVALMGPSGAGKSTCLNILGCLDRPTAGQYFFQGVDVAGLSRTQRALLRRNFIGFIFQGFNLLSRTTALENVELPLIYRRVARNERRRRALAMLALVGLEGRAEHTPAELSGGQQQRVAIARAMVTDPAVVLADEPTGNLDTARSDEIMKLLTRLNEERGLTIVMVTHEAERRRVRAARGRVPRRAHRERPAVASRGGLMIWSTLLLAFRALRRNSLRSALTMLGIVIGVAAVIAIVTLGSGASARVSAGVSSLGDRLLFVNPGTNLGGPQRGVTVRQFTMRDVEAIAARRRGRRGCLADSEHAGHGRLRQQPLAGERHRHHEGVLLRPQCGTRARRASSSRGNIRAGGSSASSARPCARNCSARPIRSGRRFESASRRAPSSASSSRRASRASVRTRTT